MPRAGSGSWRLNDERTHRVELRACSTANTCQRRPGEADTSLAIKICERLVESPAFALSSTRDLSSKKYRSLACSRAIRSDFYGSDQVAEYQARSRRCHWSVYGLHMDSKTVLRRKT